MNPFFHKEAVAIRAMWQSRALYAAKGITAKVLGCALMNEYAMAMPILLRVTFPNFKDVQLPALTGYATVWPSGRISCAMIDTNRNRKVVEVYASEEEMRGGFRRLADELKLSDAERVEMFAVLKKWITRDLRVGVNGEKLAS